MIFEGFKRAKIIKRIDRDLKEKRVSRVNNDEKIKSVLLFFEESIDDRILQVYREELSTSRAEVNIVVFKKKNNNDGLSCNYITSKDFELFGKLKDGRVKELLNSNIDLLVNYVQSNYFLNSMAAQSNALFKVRKPEDNKFIYDLMIDVYEGGNISFSSELKRYLKILNKI